MLARSCVTRVADFDETAGWLVIGWVSGFEADAAPTRALCWLCHRTWAGANL